MMQVFTPKVATSLTLRGGSGLRSLVFPVFDQGNRTVLQRQSLKKSLSASVRLRHIQNDVGPWKAHAWTDFERL